MTTQPRANTSLNYEATLATRILFVSIINSTSSIVDNIKRNTVTLLSSLLVFDARKFHLRDKCFCIIITILRFVHTTKFEGKRWKRSACAQFL